MTVPRPPWSPVRGTALALFLILAPCAAVRAQSWEEPLQTDRPGMANPPSVVEPGRFQFEWGLESYTTGEARVRYLPTLLARTGLGKDVEIRAGLAWQDQLDRAISPEATAGFSSFSIGIKVRFMEQNGVWPNAAVAVNLGLPDTGNRLFRTPHAAPGVTLEFDQDLSKEWNLNTNLGYGRDGQTLDGTASWAVCLNFQASRRASLFIESYGAVPQGGGSVTGIDGGLAFLLSPAVQLDASAGLADGPDKPNHFVALGFSCAFR